MSVVDTYLYSLVMNSNNTVMHLQRRNSDKIETKISQSCADNETQTLPQQLWFVIQQNDISTFKRLLNVITETQQPQDCTVPSKRNQYTV